MSDLKHPELATLDANLSAQVAAPRSPSSACGRARPQQLDGFGHERAPHEVEPKVDYRPAGSHPDNSILTTSPGPAKVEMRTSMSARKPDNDTKSCHAPDSAGTMGVMTTERFQSDRARAISDRIKQIGASALVAGDPASESVVRDADAFLMDAVDRSSAFVKLLDDLDRPVRRAFIAALQSHLLARSQAKNCGR